MQRRDFNAAAAAAAALLSGCGGGGSSVEPVTGTTPPPPAAPPLAAAPPQPVPASPPVAGVAVPAPAAAPEPAPQAQAPAAPEAAVAGGFVIGTNLASLELSGPGVRFGASTLPNVNFTVPRRADMAWLAANGFTKSRLPIRWEMLQPVLNDTNINAATRAILGNPGEFHPGYAAYIKYVLDAHAAAGTKCWIDVHNYCRYTDFVYQPDGSVRGLVKPPSALIHPYTTDSTQVQTRIMALAPGATLKLTNYVDFMARLAAAWKGHPGLGGFGMMNEPYYLPKPGTTVEAFEGWGQDLTIWPTFAKAAITAMRSIDADVPIYLSGNDWSGAWTLGTNNPGWPVAASNIIYEVHGYLDAFSNGNGVDWDLEAQRGFTAGVAVAPIDAQTGVNRLKQAVAFTQPRGLKLALTETGMAVDDPRWLESYLNLLNYARANGVEMYSWSGGEHWQHHNRSMNHVPGWHQNKTLEPQQSGPMKAVAGVMKATIYDDGNGWAPAGASVTITVYARGALAAPVTLNVASNNGGSFSKTTLTIPAGPNGQDSYTFTPPANTVVTLSYSSASAPNLPPPRKVYSLADPVAYASTSLPDAALAICAKYSACKWEMGNGYTDFLPGGAPAADGQMVRAVADSGYGSSAGNAMEMLNWFNTDLDMGYYTPPVMRTVNGRKAIDLTVYNTFGLWCRKVWVVPGLDPHPRNVVPYNITDPHFAIAAVAVPAATSGIVFQASAADGAYSSELAFAGGKPQARWTDSSGVSVVLTSPTALAPNAPAVISFTSTAGAQQFRVNSTPQGAGTTTFAKSLYGNDQMLLGSGFISDYPRDGFGGYLFSAITGKGTPSTAEMQVLERYLGTTAGI